MNPVAVIRVALLAAARSRIRRQSLRGTSTIAAAAEPKVQRLYLQACRAAAAAIDPERVAGALRPPLNRDALEAALREGVAAFDDTMRAPLALLLTPVYLKARAYAAAQLGVTEPVTHQRAASTDP